jgi:hypothetical protein
LIVTVRMAPVMSRAGELQRLLAELTGHTCAHVRP